MPLRASSSATHIEIPLKDPERWVLFLAPQQPTRLVVFVHGFHGKAVGTWEAFPDAGLTRQWWNTSDMLFVGYRSHRDTIVGIANRLRTRLPDFYPTVPNKVLEERDCRLRENKSYDELVLVAHSLGGVVVRWALLEVARRWSNELKSNPSTSRPRLLDAKQVLFSPAIGGVRYTGKFALLDGFDPGAFIKTVLSASPAYVELTKSKLLEEAREETEESSTLITKSTSRRSQPRFCGPSLTTSCNPPVTSATPLTPKTVLTTNPSASRVPDTRHHACSWKPVARDERAARRPGTVSPACIRNKLARCASIRS